MAGNDSPEIPSGDSPADGQSSEASAEAPQSSEPGEWFSETIEELEYQTFGPELAPGGIGRDAGCRTQGGCLGFLLIIPAMIAASIAIFSPFGGDSSDDAPSQDAPQTQSQQAVQPDVGGASLAYENEYDADGNLVPIPGEWHVYNEAGVDTCTYDISLDPSVQRVELEVLDGGERILIREIFEDESVGPAFVLERISSSDTEATYREDLSEQIGRDQAIEGTFSSSSTWGGKVEGCPDRGAQGSLAEPSG